jgi:hypothetical protein
MSQIKIEAVVVCIGYSDFLKVTLPNNKSLFNRMVVVTDTKDLATFQVCQFYNVPCIQTDAFYTDGPVANKALGINEGLKKLDKDGWVVQLDADIWLPPLTKELLDRLSLDKDCIYGIDRLMCNSYKAWQEFIHQSIHKPIYDGWVYMHMHHFPIGQRVVQYKGDGYWPIGFFQMWNPIGSGVITYPREHAAYDRTDVLHLKQFPAGKRKFIPEIVCIHLASEEPFMGQNWGGRKSKSFGPEMKESMVKRLLKGIRKAYHKITSKGYKIVNKCGSY